MLTLHSINPFTNKISTNQQWLIVRKAGLKMSLFFNMTCCRSYFWSEVYPFDLLWQKILVFLTLFNLWSNSSNTPPWCPDHSKCSWGRPLLLSIPRKGNNISFVFRWTITKKVISTPASVSGWHHGLICLARWIPSKLFTFFWLTLISGWWAWPYEGMQIFYMSWSPINCTDL